MNIASVSDKGVGVALEVSSSEVRVAVAYDETVVQPLVRLELPAFYVPQKKYGSVMPASISDWLSPLKIQIAVDNNKLEEFAANERLQQVIETLFSKVQEHLENRVDFVCATVAPSLAERDRSRLRTILQDLGFEVQLLNEDQALFKAFDRLRCNESILIYNLLSRSVEISWHRLSGQSLKLECLEVPENCGLDVLDIRLLSALFEGTKQHSLPVPLVHSLFQAVRRQRRSWEPGQDLKISVDMPEGVGNYSLSTERVGRIFESFLGQSFVTVRRMISHWTPTPFTIYLGTSPYMPYITTHLQQVVGGEVLFIDRNKVIEGAALYAREKSGIASIDYNSGMKLPEVIEFPMSKKTSDNRPAQLLSDFSNYSKPLGKDALESVLVNTIQKHLDEIFQAMEPLSAGDIQSLIPAIRLTFEEFLVQGLDHAANKLIRQHKFEEALKIYSSYWKEKRGFQRLAPRAVGLCLDQAKIALRQKKPSTVIQAKHWVKKGLEFDSNHPELLAIKRELRRKKRRSRKKR